MLLLHLDFTVIYLFLSFRQRINIILYDLIAILIILIQFLKSWSFCMMLDIKCHMNDLISSLMSIIAISTRYANSRFIYFLYSSHLDVCYSFFCTL